MKKRTGLIGLLMYGMSLLPGVPNSAVPYTPLDEVKRQAERVAREITYDHLSGITIKKVNPLPIQSPEFTEKFGSGVCKDYAVLLYDRLKKAGFNPRLQIGRRKRNYPISHAWVECGDLSIEPQNGMLYNKDTCNEYGIYQQGYKEGWENSYESGAVKFRKEVEKLNLHAGRTVVEIR